MTYEQFINKVSKTNKEYFKCTNRKNGKIKYTVSDNIEHCISRYNNLWWDVSKISIEEFVDNYPFTPEDFKNILNNIKQHHS